MLKNFAKFAVLASLLVCMTAFVGCAKNDGLCDVSGTVTLDGIPLEKGTINMGPMAGQSGTAVGGEIVKGKYKIRASQGEMVVTIRSQLREMVDDADHGQVMNFTEQIPAKYNSRSELKATINTGKNEVNFDLVSDGADAEAAE